MQDSQLITIGVFTVAACALIIVFASNLNSKVTAATRRERYTQGAPLPAGDGAAPASIHFFADNKCSPTCCTESNFGCSGGCVCLSEAQRMALSNRSNNGGVNVGRTDFYQ